MDSDAFMFDRDVETMPRAALAELQSVRLRQTLEYAYANVAQHKKKFDAAGVKPSDCKDLVDIEQTCRGSLLEHADPGEDAVGMDISLRHLAPTLLGMTVEITAKVMAVEGRKVSFEVTAKDELEPISGGTHARFVVDVSNTYARLKAKAERRDAARKG